MGEDENWRRDRLRVEIKPSEVTIEIETYAGKARMTIDRAQAERMAKRILRNQPRGYVETAGIVRRTREADGNSDGN